MTKNKNCPICFTENSKELDSCKNCGFSFIDAKSENTDWLDSLRSDDQDKHSSEEVLTPGNPFTSSEFLSETNQDDKPDWLSRIQVKNETEENFSQVEENKLSSEKNNIFASDSTSEEKQALGSEGEIPEWLNQMRNSSSDSEENASEHSGSDLPDWLSGDKDEEPINQEHQITAENTLPDWLTNVSSDEPNDETTNQQSNWQPADEIDHDINNQLPSTVSPFEKIQSDELEQEDLPEWLTKSSKDSQSKQIEPAETNTEPDWLQDLSDLHSEDHKIEKEELSPQNWNSNLAEEPKITSEFFIPPFAAASASENEAVSELPFQDEEIHENQFTDESKQGTSSAPFYEDDLNVEEPKTPFIEQNSSLSSQKRTDHTAQPFTLDDMPDWLEDIDKVRNDELEETAPDITKIGDEKVQLGNLPSWLKAMRPVSAVAPSEIRKEDRKKIEKTGPLAGLQGVLSSESAINHYTAPPTYASKVNITDKNKIHAQLLEDVFSQEKFQKTKTHSKSNLEFTIVRLIIPIILITTLIFSFFNKSVDDNLSDVRRNMPAVQFASIANSLSTTLNTAPHILIVMDTDAASIGELELVTQRAFETFMSQNSWLAVIATNPTGLIVSDEIIRISKQNVASYNDIERITTLGYLPGNETGIQGFISNPQFLVQKSKNGQSVWSTPGLMNIKTISDFDSIWVISDNAESTQKWIEQLHAANISKPILISATTQATPILSTYLVAGQFDGLIGGLQGASTYEQLTTNNPSSFIQTWQLYQSAIFIFLLIILGGAVFQIFETVINSKNK